MFELDITDSRHVRDFVINQFGREIGNYGETRPEIEMSFPKTCMVIGLGGIGGHLAEYLGAMKNIKNLVVVDDDEVELSNLNRTVYSYFHIGMTKAEAIAAQIIGRNVGVQVKPLITKFDEDLVTTILEHGVGFKFEDIFEPVGSEVLVFDCRDGFFDDYDQFNRLFDGKCKYRIIRAAYDGLSMTIDANPTEHHVWGGNRGYQTVPSHALPSRLVAMLAVSMATSIYNDPAGNAAKRFESPMTFHMFDLMHLIADGFKYRESIGEETIPVDETSADSLDDLVEADVYSDDETLDVEVASVEAPFLEPIVAIGGIDETELTGAAAG
ncbi:MAG: ThiF family adenylyltransferase [Candidatus Peribacteraceae bacterium]|nr:ThiF family adenylyltransferase [Candidatus Peribacteraceae bacterium]